MHLYSKREERSYLMGHKVFVSYKYKDYDVEKMGNKEFQNYAASCVGKEICDDDLYL